MEATLGAPVSRRAAVGTMGMMGAAATLPTLDEMAEPVPVRRNVEGKVALVTGSGRNLGGATVLVANMARRR